MAREKERNGAPAEPTISVIGPGMKFTGDCETEGTIRVDGTVEGSIKAGKAVVIGERGLVKGDVATKDAVVAGRVMGNVVAESRLEFQSTCQLDGEVRARRIQVGEGAILNGSVHMIAQAS